MTREELEKQGLLIPMEEAKKWAHAYAARIPMPKTVGEFKDVLAEAYFAGIEVTSDFYLDKGHWHCTKKCSHIYPCPIGREKEETK